ncbi:MAG: YkgJ family cysteine cluster protein [Candidatus Heimdallarchaeota archaeon]|nr:MAG: YkgJ family cysteine cluster protein [Candidatus Heimdallarchaeota archaeon]
MSEKESKEEMKKDSETSSGEETKKDEKGQVEQETAAKPKTKKKYVFNCTKCGNCCDKREFVPVALVDIHNWTQSGIINAVFPNLKLRTLQPAGSEEKQGVLALVIAGSENGCTMFDKENRLCNIYHSMPLECKAFPLGFNGQNYFIKDKSVTGLGHGTMTKERLIEDRDNARLDFEAKVETQMILPLLYSLFMQNLLEQQQKVMEEMPEEKRKQLDELLKPKEQNSN